METHQNCSAFINSRNIEIFSLPMNFFFLSRTTSQIDWWLQLQLNLNSYLIFTSIPIKNSWFKTAIQAQEINLCHSSYIIYIHSLQLLFTQKKNGTLWKMVDLLWLDQCKFIPSMSLMSLVFFMTLLHLHDRLHPPRHWFIQFVGVVMHHASPDLFVDG